jgi:hypothetical protein
MKPQRLRELIQLAVERGESRLPNDRQRLIYTRALLTELLVAAANNDSAVIERIVYLAQRSDR